MAVVALKGEIDEVISISDSLICVRNRTGATLIGVYIPNGAHPSDVKKPVFKELEDAIVAVGNATLSVDGDFNTGVEPYGCRCDNCLKGGQLCLVYECP